MLPSGTDVAGPLHATLHLGFLTDAEWFQLKQKSSPDHILEKLFSTGTPFMRICGIRWRSFCFSNWSYIGNRGVRFGVI